MFVGVYSPSDSGCDMAGVSDSVTYSGTQSRWSTYCTQHLPG